MSRQLDPEDRAAIAKAQEEGGRAHGRRLQETIDQALENARNDARARQHDHPDP